MAKTSALDRAIAQLDKEINVLELARNALASHRPATKPKAKRGPRAVPGDGREAGGE